MRTLNISRSICALFIILLAATHSFAQSANQIWYFGDHAGLDFTSGSPVVLTNSQMYADEGCVTITDNAGNLKFYTNGDKIWDSTHTVMPNGTGLGSPGSCSQSSLVVRKPGSTTIFYVFTLAAQGNANGLMWSEIDMTLNSGLGDVTSNRNNQLVTPACEKLTAVRHANGIDIWVIVHQLNSNAFNTYLVTGAGVSSPVVSNTGITISSSFSNVETIGCMKVSCNGGKLAVAHYGNNTVQLFDFNTSTGVISNPVTLNSTYQPYGVEFSPSGRYLYVDEPNWSGSPIYQYDLNASNIAQSQMVIGTVPATSGTAATLQVAPDHKIYIAVLFDTAISVIQNPDQAGLSSNFLAGTISLGGRTSLYGLPNYMVGVYCVPGNPDAIEVSFSNSLVSVYPNPANDFVTVDGSKLNAAYTVTISNMLGQEVYAREYKRGDVAEIELSQFETGIYFVRTETAELVFEKKLLLAK